jgi:hypothetical protein
MPGFHFPELLSIALYFIEALRTLPPDDRRKHDAITMRSQSVENAQGPFRRLG